MLTPSRSQRGQTLVLFALLIPVFVGMLALAVDVGRWYVARESLQIAVDAASDAASQKVDVNAFEAEGELRFDEGLANAAAGDAFGLVVADLTRIGASGALTGITFDETENSVTVSGQASVPPVFPLSPSITLSAISTSQAGLEEEQQP